MKFVPSTSMKVDVLPEQQDQISTKETIEKGIADKAYLGFDIYDEEKLVGFAALCKYKKACYFLWNYAIDYRYQNQHYGTRALIELAELFKKEYGARSLVTTYIYGNEHAKHVYEKVGFVEYNVVDEPDCHEVDMKLKLK